MKSAIKFIVTFTLGFMVGMIAYKYVIDTQVKAYIESEHSNLEDQDSIELMDSATLKDSLKDSYSHPNAWTDPGNVIHFIPAGKLSIDLSKQDGTPPTGFAHFQGTTITGLGSGQYTVETISSSGIESWIPSYAGDSGFYTGKKTIGRSKNSCKKILTIQK